MLVFRGVPLLETFGANPCAHPIFQNTTHSRYVNHHPRSIPQKDDVTLSTESTVVASSKRTKIPNSDLHKWATQVELHPIKLNPTPEYQWLKLKFILKTYGGMNIHQNKTSKQKKR